MPITKLVDVESSLLEEEKKLKVKSKEDITSYTSPNEVALYSSNKGYKGKAKYDSSIICDFCHKPGHIERECFSRKKAQKAYIMHEEYGEQSEDHGEPKEDHNGHDEALSMQCNHLF